MNRRDLIKLGCVTAVGLGAGGPLLAAGPRRRPDLVLVDERFAAGRAFAAVARRAGATIVATEGDVASLRYGALRDAPLAGLAGLTGYADMVVIASLAAEQRRTFALRMRHDVTGARATHRIVDGLPAHGGVLAMAGGQWPHGLWSIMQGQRVAGVARAGQAAGRDGTLWSWAIA